MSSGHVVCAVVIGVMALGLVVLGHLCAHLIEELDRRRTWRQP